MDMHSSDLAGSPKMAELMKRNRKLQALVTQRELTQEEKDDWEEIVRQITQLQEESQSSKSLD